MRANNGFGQVWRVRFPAAVIAIVVAVGLAPQALGQADTWDGGGTTASWSDDLNWVDNSAPPVDPTTTSNANPGIRLGVTNPARLATDLNATFRMGRLEFANASGYVVNTSNGSALQLSGFNTGETILLTPSVIATSTPISPFVATINAPVNLVTGGNNTTNLRTINTSGSDTATLFLNGPLNAGTFDVQKNGAGTLVLGSANTLVGLFNINNGAVLIGNDAAFGTATVANPSGNNIQIASTDATARTLANGFAFSGQGGVSFNPGTVGGAGNFTINGPITLGTVGTGIQTVGGGVGTTTVFNGQISGAGGLSKATTSTLVLNGANNYTGTTNVGNGVLVVNGASVSDTTVGGGTLQGVGQARVLSVFGNTANAGPEGTLSPGDNTAAGVFTAGRADFGSGGTFLVNLNDVNGAAGVGFDQLLLNGNGATPNSNLAVSATAGTFTIDLDGPGTGFDPSQAYSFTIVDAADVTGATPTDPFDPSSVVVDASGFAPSLAGGSFSVVESSGGNLDLVFTPVPEPATLGLLGMAGLGLLARRRR